MFFEFFLTVLFIIGAIIYIFTEALYYGAIAIGIIVGLVLIVYLVAFLLGILMYVKAQSMRLLAGILPRGSEMQIRANEKWLDYKYPKRARNKKTRENKVQK